ncbi:tyrosine-type recombinase/integrase [Roseomonas sp. FDAARGOS_362]|uniref:tyrosine-type recombinase/integrase n=1 Tax=Roseomonas sp. FDAARGOS_362 TaxID=2018065 RepID=UPI000F80DA02|nr:tyrosine-type recombinase/integrase [Roseomonas sp. FDAARGOS_362]
MRERIRALTQPAAYAGLLHEPARLMRLAKDQDLTPVEAARQARLAAMLEILTICPMRLSNLLGLRLDRHLRYLGPKGRRLTHLVIAGHEVKNGEPIEWPVPEESARLIERYIRSYRPDLTDEGNPYLFPGAGAGPISASSLSHHLKAHLWEVIGVEVNPHLMRSFAAWLHLRHYPEAIDEVRRILGHRSIETTMRHYILFEKEAAALRFGRSVLRLREETRGLALASRLVRRPVARAGWAGERRSQAALPAPARVAGVSSPDLGGVPGQPGPAVAPAVQGKALGAGQHHQGRGRLGPLPGLPAVARAARSGPPAGGAGDRRERRPVLR